MGLWPVIVAPFMGSFLGVVIRRLPRRAPVGWARSACPHCGHRLGWRDLVPLVSFAVQRGRCRYCGGSIGWFEPAIELAALALAIWAVAALPAPMVWPGLGLGWTLLALGLIDARDRILPDVLTLPLMLAGLGVAWWVTPDALIDHAVGALAGFAGLAAVGLGYRRLRGREGLGFGDAKLAAAAGAWVSWQGLAGVILLGAVASLAALLVLSVLGGRRLTATAPVPFGPGLALATWIVWVHGPIVFAWG